MMLESGMLWFKPSRTSARGYVGRGDTFVTVLEHGENVGPVIYIHMYEVPEPATSTLSLLALAALAARRRRSR